MARLGDGNHAKMQHRCANRFARAAEAAAILGGKAVWVDDRGVIVVPMHASRPSYDQSLYARSGCVSRGHAAVRLPDGTVLGWQQACKRAGLWAKVDVA